MSTPDPDDRLGLERFDAVDAPDQWADIVRRADAGGSAGSKVVATRRNRTWYLAAAASFVALVGGLVIVSQTRNDDVTTPIDRPPGGTDVPTGCRSESDLDEIVGLLSSIASLSYDYRPAGDLDSLIERSDVVVRGEITGVDRANDPGAIGYAAISLASSSVLVGETAGELDGFAMSSLWAEAAGPDPLADPRAFDGLGVIAFLSADDDAPFGWTSRVEEVIVACSDRPATGLVQPAPFLDLSSLDALETQITGVEPATTVTTEPMPTDTSPTTEPDDTVPETAAVDERWTPTCVESFGSGDAASDDAGLDEFGPLGAVPGLDIVLPEFRSSDQAAPAAVNVAVGRVDGGTAVLARPYEGEITNAYILSVVDDDGSVRWRRCLDGFVAGSMLTAPGADEVTVGEYPPTTDGGPSWHTFSLATGLDRDPIAVPAGLDQLVVDDHYSLFGPRGDRLSTTDDQLAVLDLRSGELDVIPYPPDFGIPVFRHEFEVIDEGSGAYVILQRVDGPQSPVSSVYVDGAWTTDDATILASAPVRAVLTFDERGWEGHDGLGEVVWSRPDLLDIRREGFLSDVSDSVTVINGCREQSDAGCVDGSLFGIDTATGETRWERDGLRGVSAVGDGFAIVTNDAGDGWEMIDTLTGEIVDESQQWAGIEPFAQECCGAGDFVWVGRDRGIVFAVNGDRIRVWYPQDHAGATIDVSVMD